MKNEKKIISIIVFVIASLFLVLTFGFPNNNARDVGPALLPQLYSGALFILCIALFIQGVKEKKTTSTAPKNFLLIFLSMLVSVVYVLLIPYLGFYVITPIVMIVLLKITRVKSIITLLLVPGGTTFFIWIFFGKMLKVPVPSGIFFS